MRFNVLPVLYYYYYEYDHHHLYFACYLRFKYKIQKGLTKKNVEFESPVSFWSSTLLMKSIIG